MFRAERYLSAFVILVLSDTANDYQLLDHQAHSEVVLNAYIKTVQVDKCDGGFSMYRLMSPAGRSCNGTSETRLYLRMMDFGFLLSRLKHEMRCLAISISNKPLIRCIPRGNVWRQYVAT